MLSEESGGSETEEIDVCPLPSVPHRELRAPARGPRKTAGERGDERRAGRKEIAGYPLSQGVRPGTSRAQPLSCLRLQI